MITTHLWRSRNSWYSSTGFMSCMLFSIRRWISWNEFDVRSLYWDASCKMLFLQNGFLTIFNLVWMKTYADKCHQHIWLVSQFYQTTTNSSCIDCWCSNSPGKRIVRKSDSTSDASLINKTYSLCAKCSFRHAFWYLSRTSSNFRPPRPAMYMKTE